MRAGAAQALADQEREQDAKAGGIVAVLTGNASLEP